MSRSTRNIPKAIAQFGEKQFTESGAELVEVLRVKASTVRKHFKKMMGISFLVAVISLDRVRIYFFNQAGVLVVGENVDHSQYEKIRKTARLLSKFEKERPPTPEELRMEATEDLRKSLAAAIRRTARILGISEPPFPDVYVTKSSSSELSQVFGIEIEDDGTIIFEESALRAGWSTGIVSRTAFLVTMASFQHHPERILHPFVQFVANGFAFSQIKDTKIRTDWVHKWRDSTSQSELQPLVNHFITHSETYEGVGFRRIQQFIGNSPLEKDHESWLKALQLIHDTLEVQIVQDDYHTIEQFCGTLRNTNRLSKKKHTINKIHLAPRVIVNPIPLGTNYYITTDLEKAPPSTKLSLKLYRNKGESNLAIAENHGTPIKSLDYWLDIRDIFPKSAGIISHGGSIFSWITKIFKRDVSWSPTYEAHLEFRATSLKKNELAVLERLAEGDLEVLANTLIGSPGVFRSLVESENVVLLPSFNHLGLQTDYYIEGPQKELMTVLRGNVLEATIFHTEESSYALVSATSIWAKRMLAESVRCNLELYPVIRVDQAGAFLRKEKPPVGEILQWSDGPST